MIAPIMKDIIFLSQKAEPATKKDKQVISDLEDTLKAHADGCVGMAANMIGVNKRIIVLFAGKKLLTMVNPVLLKKAEPYATEEGCLSLEGQRPCTRYREIEVSYLDKGFCKQKERFTGWTAQIIQHELDHCEGIII